MPKLFYGCVHCRKFRECVIEEKYGEDCPVEAFEKSKDDLKQALMETKVYKVAEWLLDKLEAIIESFH